MSHTHRHAAFQTIDYCADDLSGTLVLRDLIDEALHFVITSNYPKTNQGLGKCQVYAALGAKVISRILGRPFQAVAGGQITDFGGGMYAVSCPSRNERRKARCLEELSKYHCWIESVRTVPGQEGKIEIVDFTVRHDRLMAELLGHPYLIRHKRDYLWCWRDDLVMPNELMNHPELGGRKEKFWVWKDERCTLLLKENEEKHELHYEAMAGEVFRRLGDHIDNVFPISSPLIASVREHVSHPQV